MNQARMKVIGWSAETNPATLFSAQCHLPCDGKQFEEAEDSAADLKLELHFNWS